MKIATWNIERPTKTDKRISLIINHLREIDADILILTETNDAVNPGRQYNSFHTSILNDEVYKEGERRVSVYSKYSGIGHIYTYNNDTSICVTLNTPLGHLAVYGTVIGIKGNRGYNYNEELALQSLDFERISSRNNLCIAGDLNMTFSDNYYFTKQGRQNLNNIFEKLNLTNLTAAIPENIDHVIISKDFVKSYSFALSTWNLDKLLSDHIGVCVTLIKN